MEADGAAVIMPEIELGSLAEDALRRTYTAEYARLVGLARLLVDRRDEAEEVVQEAFARTWANLGKVRGADPLPYVRRAVVNLSRAGCAGVAPPPPTALTPRSTPNRPNTAPFRRATDQAVLDHLRDLPRRQRECVVLRFYDDLTVPEIARSLGVAEGSVKSHLHRAMATLAIELEDQR